MKANLDISHLALARQPAALDREPAGQVAHVHISDCDGKVHGDLPPGRGVVDFPPYLDAIKQLDIPDAAISIELEYSPEPDRIVEWVAEAYEKTASLMRAAGFAIEPDSQSLWHRRSLRRARSRRRLARSRNGAGSLAALRPRRERAARFGLRRSMWQPGLKSSANPATWPGSLLWHSRAPSSCSRPRRSHFPWGFSWRSSFFGPTQPEASCCLASMILAAFVPLPLHATSWLGAFGNVGRHQLFGWQPILVGRSGAAFVHAMATLPWVVLIGGMGLCAVEPELEESALLDHTPARVLRTVTFRRVLSQSPRRGWQWRCSRPEI